MKDFRNYQKAVVENDDLGILILHWSRQIGKSYALASWAVSRLINQLGKYPDWLVTVLSNSRDNGAEFCRKAAQACDIAEDRSFTIEVELDADAREDLRKPDYSNVSSPCLSVSICVHPWYKNRVCRRSSAPWLKMQNRIRHQSHQIIERLGSRRVRRLSHLCPLSPLCLTVFSHWPITKALKSNIFHSLTSLRGWFSGLIPRMGGL